MALSERDLEAPDPLRLDREVAGAAEAFRRDVRRLAGGEGLEDDPFFGRRLVTSRSAFTAVSEMPAADPLREPLRRWIYRLAEHRIDRAALARLSAEYRLVEQVVPEPERIRAPLAEVLARALNEPARQEAWLTSYLRACERVGTLAAVLWERRREVAIRLGLGGPDAIETPGTNGVDAASRFLDRTADMFGELVPPKLGGLLDVALGRKAAEGWPRHLLPRSLLDFFRDTDLFRSVELDPGRLPAAAAPASFLRALLRLGAAWADATAPHDQPFVVAHDPYGLHRYTRGALFGGLPLTSAFARRALGLDASRLVPHLRATAGVVLVGARIAALRVLLRPHALEGRRRLCEAYQAEAHRALGVTLPRDSAGAFVRLHVDDVQRFAGLLLGASEALRLRSRHDEDWYRNPRAVEQLRDEARLSPDPLVGDDALAAGSDALYASLLERLG